MLFQELSRHFGSRWLRGHVLASWLTEIGQHLSSRSSFSTIAGQLLGSRGKSPGRVASRNRSAKLRARAARNGLEEGPHASRRPRAEAFATVTKSDANFQAHMARGNKAADGAAKREREPRGLSRLGPRWSGRGDSGAGFARQAVTTTLATVPS